MDTIYAVSSGRPPAAIAVLRLSGADATAAAIALARTLPSPRTAAVRTLRAADGTLLDRALVLHFPAPHTATGEDLVELHLHGGRAVVAAVEAELATIPRLRPAAPGEFTRRALANGRIDLIQAQGLADLLEAETEQQRRLAIDAAEGATSRLVCTWLDELARLGALIEAAIDFEDEDDVPPADMAALDQVQATLLAAFDATLARAPVERYRDGIRIVLVGPPNAGKSSLFNALIGRDAAIVSPIAGTTRDRIEASVHRNGRAYLLTDTAGLRVYSDDPIERLGIKRAAAAQAAADVVLDLSDEPTSSAIAVYAKYDIRPIAPSGRLSTATDDPQSIEALWAAIERRGDAVLGTSDGPSFHEAERQAIVTARSALAMASDEPDLLLRAEAVRQATRALAGLLGVDATETMLDALFSRFCVGK